MNKRLLLVSFDAVGETDIDKLLLMPHFSSLAKKGGLVRDVESVFLSNTYPAHTSIVTGVHPRTHGVIENTFPYPGDDNPDWAWYEKAIGAPTLFQKAHAAGLRSAAVMWPVTAGSKSIRYNVPEIFANKWWKTQITQSLFAGSPLLQIRGVLKYGRGLHGTGQPELDDFSAPMMADIIARKKPDVMALHLTDADTNKHLYGNKSTEAMDALRRMDDRLGLLLHSLEKAGIREETAVVVLGDHYQRDIALEWDPNDLLLEKGLLSKDQRGHIDSWRAWMKCAGGCAFLYLKDKNDREAERIVRALFDQLINEDPYPIRRYLTREEMDVSGFSRECPLGVEASDAVAFSEHYGAAHKAQHGYALDHEHYTTFYLAAADGITPNRVLTGGSILDIAPLCFQLLGLPPEKTDGQLLKGLFSK